MTEVPSVLFTAEEIGRRVAEVGAEVARATEGGSPMVVGLMKSCMCFLADLVRAVPADLTCHFLRVQAHEEGEPPHTKIVYPPGIPWQGKDVIILDDIVDTAVTLSYLLQQVREQGPRSLRTCALIDIPGERKLDFRPDWALFTLDARPPDRLIVGYGLDRGDHFRGLPYLATVKRLPGAPAIMNDSPGRRAGAQGKAEGKT